MFDKGILFFSQKKGLKAAEYYALTLSTYFLLIKRWLKKAYTCHTCN